MEPPLRALDADWVFYVGSFSKILAPALRVGWIIAPESLMPALSIIKEASDIDTSTFGQRIVSGFIDAGHLPAHLEKLRAEYRSRRDSMLRALNEHFPVQANWRKPTSGVFTWVDLPKRLDVSELLRLSIEEERVAFIPSDAFAFGINSQSHGIRLNFSHHAPAVIEEGIARIARILKQTLRAGF
jgi:2-aminoadipate transaminase